MVHARTIHEAAKYFKEVDPQTCISENAIRNLVKNNTINCVKIGKKYLVTLESIEEYLQSICINN